VLTEAEDRIDIDLSTAVEEWRDALQMLVVSPQAIGIGIRPDCRMIFISRGFIEQGVAGRKC